MQRKRMCSNRKSDFILILCTAIFLTISFFVVAQLNTDDSGTFLWVYWQYDLGCVDHSFKEMIEPWNLTIQLLYFLGIGNTGAEMVIYCYAIWYFICIFITLNLAMKDIKKNKWLLLLTVFIFIPYAGTNKNHLVPAAIALLTINAICNYVSEKKKIPLIFAGILLLYFFVTINDRVILLLFLAIPAALYGVIWCLQNIDRQKILYFAAVAVAVIVAGIKIIDEVSRILLGRGLALLESWGGYGGESYLTWIDIYNLFDKGIPSFFSSLMLQYNIPVDGGLIQFNSFFWLVRILIIGLALVALASRWKDIIKKGIADIHILDALSTISVTALIGVNILNGMIEYYDIEGAPMNRYASLAWFLLIVILIRWIDEKYKQITLMNIGKRKIQSGIVLGILCSLLIVGYSNPIYLGRQAIVKEPCQNELDFLKEQNGQYKYGLASFWKSAPIIAMTNGEYNACPGWVENDEVDHEKLYLKCNIGQGIYDDGSNYFNYMISYVNNDMTMTEENIEKLRGDYIDKKRVYGEDEESIFYLYDYDIRWEPRLIMEAVGTDYELIEPIEYNFEFPVGTNRIEMEVGNSANFELAIVDNSDIKDVSIQKKDDNKIYVDLVCLQNTDVTFMVSRKSDELTTIHKIVLKRVLGAVTVYENGQKEELELYLNGGDYVFTFAGENLGNLDVEWLGNGIEVEQLTDGKIRRRYHIKVDEPQKIQFIFSGEKVKVDKISYENAVLFEEK